MPTGILAPRSGHPGTRSKACAQTFHHALRAGYSDCRGRYELGHLQLVAKQMKDIERLDPDEVLNAKALPALAFKSQRRFVRDVLAPDVGFRALGTESERGEESADTLAYREQRNSSGPPSDGWPRTTALPPAPN